MKPKALQPRIEQLTKRKLILFLKLNLKQGKLYRPLISTLISHHLHSQSIHTKKLDVSFFYRFQTVICIDVLFLESDLSLNSCVIKLPYLFRLCKIKRMVLIVNW